MMIYSPSEEGRQQAGASAGPVRCGPVFAEPGGEGRRGALYKHADPTGALGVTGRADQALSMGSCASPGGPAREGRARAPPASPGRTGVEKEQLMSSTRCARYNKGLAAPGGKGSGAALRLVSQRSSSRRRPPARPAHPPYMCLPGCPVCPSAPRRPGCSLRGLRADLSSSRSPLPLSLGGS